MQERTSLEDQLTGIGKIERELEDQIGMIELGEAEKDEGVVTEAEQALRNLKKEVARREIASFKESVGEFVRRAWPLLLIAFVVLLLTLYAGR